MESNATLRGGHSPNLIELIARGCSLLFLPLIMACGGEEMPQKNALGGHKENATLMKLQERPYGKLLKLLKKNGKERSRYRLIEKNEASVPEGGPAKNIEVPVDRIACLSSTHAGMLLELEESDRIVAFPDKKYLYDQKLRERMDSGRIESIGMQRSMDVERLVSLEAELLIDDGMSGREKGKKKTLRQAGIPTLNVLAWKEKHPLGRAEWIRLFGILTGKEKKADSLYEGLAHAYDSLAGLASDKKERPKVLCNAPHKGTWHIPGGKSYMAKMIEDAGGIHPWPEDRSTGGVPKTLEEVMARAGDADLWINPGRARSLEELKGMDERMVRFKAFQEASVFNNDRRKEEGRGNDHWESGPVRPHQILADLIAIFHPDLLPDRKLRYYRELPRRKDS